MAQFLPQECVEHFLKDTERNPYANNMFFDKETKTAYFFNPTKGIYELVNDEEMLRILLAYIPMHYPSKAVTMSVVRDIYEQILYTAPTIDTSRENYISFANGLFSFDNPTAPLLPYIQSTHAIALIHFPFDYNPESSPPTPVWDYFLRSSLVLEDNVLAHDASLAVLVQEMFGYFLMPTIPEPAMFFLVGEGSNGKSKITDILLEVFGGKNSPYISAHSIESLTTDRFAASSLVGVKANICSEEESKYLRTDKFKLISGGEAVNAQRKYGKTFTFKPRAKFLFSSNNMPTFDGVDYALRRRMKIIPLFRRFTQKDKDSSLGEKLKKEIPGIAHWAIAGALRFISNNFTFSTDLSPAALKALDEFESDSSPAFAFFREFYEAHDQCFTASSDIYKHYVTWCLESGRKSLNESKFFKNFSRACKLPSWTTTVTQDQRRIKVRGYSVVKTSNFIDPPPDNTLAGVTF